MQIEESDLDHSNTRQSNSEHGQRHSNLIVEMALETKKRVPGSKPRHDFAAA
jgi:hypothetical protein